MKRNQVNFSKGSAAIAIMLTGGQEVHLPMNKLPSQEKWIKCPGTVDGQASHTLEYVKIDGTNSYLVRHGKVRGKPLVASQSELKLFIQKIGTELGATVSFQGTDVAPA